MNQHPNITGSSSDKRIPPKRMALLGNILRPLVVGARNGISVENRIFLTAPVMEILRVEPDFIQFRTQDCTYDILPPTKTLLPSG